MAVKISRLRKRLASYGWAEEEVASIIFHEFLKLPVIDWHKMDSTVDYYAVKEKYMVDAGTAELILCLKEMVPDLDMPNVG